MGLGVLFRFARTTEAASDIEAAFSDNVSPSPSIISLESHLSTPSPVSPRDIAFFDEMLGNLWRHAAGRRQIFNHPDNH